MNKKTLSLLAGVALLGGAVAGVTGLASAQTSTATNTTASGTVETNRPHGHRPLGQDGVISAINGTSVTIAEEADEGNGTYTVDASAAGDLSALKVGDKVFVEGTVNGTNVKATSIGSHKDRGQDHEDPSDDTGTVSDGDGENAAQ
jgi:hypothetical protein